jgi:tRNA pseudouridine55 synthase
MTSAVKVEGERLYKKAHRGEAVETPTRTVTVHRAELLDHDGDEARFEVECSSGTYIRTLVETLGDAYCSALRRTAIGPFDVPDGDPVEVPAADLVSFLPERELDAGEATLVGHGRPVPARPGGPPGRNVRLTHDGALIAVARQDGDNLKPEVVLEPR